MCSFVFCYKVIFEILLLGWIQCGNDVVPSTVGRVIWKKIVCLCVCVFASRSKEHHISRRVLLGIDRSNLLGSRVVRVEELESDVSFQKFSWERFFYTKDHFFYNKIFSYKDWPGLAATLCRDIGIYRNWKAPFL